MARDALPSPWREFLEEIDRALSGPVALHCLGGFVVTVCHGLGRATADIDVVAFVPDARLDEVLKTAGSGSALALKYRLRVDYVSVVTTPESYEERLCEVFEGRFKNLRVFALDPYDLTLSKLGRNLDVDRDDVRFLAGAVPIDVDILRELYVRELRPFLAKPGA